MRFLLLMLFPGVLLADGGVILARETLNGLDVTVFASPIPLRAGPVDVSVLVQDAATQRALLDAEVHIAWSSVSSSSPEWMPPCCSMEKATDKIAATPAHSQNKLLYSAIVPVRSSGPSEFVVAVKTENREALLSCDVTAGPPRPPALAYWPWLALPPLAAAGFAMHQRIQRRKH